MHPKVHVLNDNVRCLVSDDFPQRLRAARLHPGADLEHVARRHPPGEWRPEVRVDRDIESGDACVSPDACERRKVGTTYIRNSITLRSHRV
jgi:hypothetical protein